MKLKYLWGLAPLAVIMMMMMMMMMVSPALGDGSEYPNRDALRERLQAEFDFDFVTRIPASQSLGMFIVDPQRDFTEPTGSLYVEGAPSDMAVIDTFIRDHLGRIEYFGYSMDSHPQYYVGNSTYWEGNPPPFTVVPGSALYDGTLVAANPNHQDRAEAYGHCLEDQGELHFVWPDHTEQGTDGWTLDPVMQPLMHDYTAYWADKVTGAPTPQMVMKALNAHTDQYGFVEALCPNEDAATHVQTPVVDELADLDVIFVTGEALNFCVAAALRMVDEGIPAENIIVGFDASSPILAFEDRTFAVIGAALDAGIRFAELEHLTVNGPWATSGDGMPEDNYSLLAE